MWQEITTVEQRNILIMKNYIITIALFLIATTFTGCEQDIVKEYNPSPKANFDALWQILDERYCYFEAKELDWTGVYNEYINEAIKAKNELILFNIMEQMLDTLQDGHVNLYTPFDISVCSGWYDSYPTDYYDSQVFSDKYLGNNYRRAGGFLYKKLDRNIGYIRYSSFSNGFGSANLKYIDAIFGDVDGIIIDVRHNGGGSLAYSERLASCFFKETTTTGYMQHKTGKGHNDFSDYTPIITDPASAPIDWSDKRVVVLTNRQCYSATNDFVVRMKQAPNVTVVGGRTGGGGGMPLSQELPNGWMIRFSAVPMYDAEYQHTEFGVDPDIEIHITDPKSDSDPIIEKAIEIIKG